MSENNEVNVGDIKYARYAVGDALKGVKVRVVYTSDDVTCGEVLETCPGYPKGYVGAFVHPLYILTDSPLEPKPLTREEMLEDALGSLMAILPKCVGLTEHEKEVWQKALDLLCEE